MIYFKNFMERPHLRLLSDDGAADAVFIMIRKSQMVGRIRVGSLGERWKTPLCRVKRDVVGNTIAR